MNLRSILRVRSLVPVAVGVVALASPLAAQRRQSARVLLDSAKVALADTSAEAPARAFRFATRALAVASSARDSALMGQALLDLGDAVDRRNAPDSAAGYYRRALAIHGKARNSNGEALALASLGQLYMRIGPPDSAAVAFRALITMHRLAGDGMLEAVAISNLATILERLNQLDSAAAYLRAALPLHRAAGNAAGEANSLVTLGALAERRGMGDSAAASYRAGLIVARAAGNRTYEALAMLRLGIVHFQALGRPDSAAFYFRELPPIARASGEPTLESFTFTSHGALFAQLGQQDSAAAYYRAALRMQREGHDQFGEAVSLEQLGRYFTATAQLDSALFYLRASLATTRALGLRENVKLSSLGTLFYRQGQLDSAVTYSRAALEIARQAKDVVAEAMALADLAAPLSDLGQVDSATALVSAALLMSRDLDLRFTEPDLRLNLAELARRRRAWGSALAQLDSASALSNSQQRAAPGDLTRVSVAERIGDLFSTWARTWLAIGDSIGAPRAAAAALAATERGRARGLLDLMSGGGATFPLGADLAREGDSLLSNGLARNESLLSYLVTTDTLVVWWRPAGGQLVVRRHAVAADSITSWVRRWRQGIRADRPDATTLLAQRTALEPEPPLPAGSQRARNEPPCDSTCSAVLGRRLATALLPAEGLAPGTQLIIVPHGPLNLLAFAALPIDGADTPLADRVGVGYTPSLAARVVALARSAVGPRERGGASALVVGDPAMPSVASAYATRVTLDPLPAARAEARAVGVRLGASPLLGDAATESAVRSALPGARIVHLATHGLAYSREAWSRRSFVALAPDSAHDGRLTVGELLDDPELTLTAELVVLSACDTGLGDVKTAEGTIGFQRAFLARGARTILVSLWKVDDQATAALLERFYAHWLEDRDTPRPTEALRRAQQDLRALPRWSAPRFWAGFQVVGVG